MGATDEETIKVREPLTYALYKWLGGIDGYTYATYPGDETFDYRSRPADR